MAVRFSCAVLVMRDCSKKIEQLDFALGRVGIKYIQLENCFSYWMVNILLHLPSNSHSATSISSGIISVRHYFRSATFFCNECIFLQGRGGGIGVQFLTTRACSVSKMLVQLRTYLVVETFKLLISVFVGFKQCFPNVFPSCSQKNLRFLANSCSFSYSMNCVRKV